MNRPHCSFVWRILFASELQINQISVCAFLSPGEIISRIMWRYLRLVGTFKFFPAQICLAEILSYLWGEQLK